MAAVKDRLLELLEDYKYHQKLKATAYENGSRAMFVYASNTMSKIRTQLENLGYDIESLEF